MPAVLAGVCRHAAAAIYLLMRRALFIALIYRRVDCRAYSRAVSIVRGRAQQRFFPFELERVTESITGNHDVRVRNKKYARS